MKGLGEPQGCSWHQDAPSASLAFPKSLFHPQNWLLAVPDVPDLAFPSIPVGTTEGKPISALRHHGTAAGGGTTGIPLPAAGIRAGAPRAIPPVGGAGAGTAAVGTRPRAARGGRGAGAGPLRPAGSGNATTPIRRTEREPFVLVFGVFFVCFVSQGDLT